jgi:hypothetical protein
MISSLKRQILRAEHQCQVKQDLRIGAAFVLAVVGCSARPAVEVAGNPALGIVKFEVEQTQFRSVVRGLSDSGEEVARLALVHGPFRLSRTFADGYDDPSVDGRKLEVNVLGQKLWWETAGYSPTLHLPSHPAGHEALAAFLEDPHVKPILQRWQIGFGPIEDATPRLSQGLTSPGGYTCDKFFISGTNPKTCTGTTTNTTIFNQRFSMCGGSEIPAGDAFVVHQDAAHWGFDQSMVTQCCPDLTFGPCSTDADCDGPSCVNGVCSVPAFFAYKACPDVTRRGNLTSCGPLGGGTCVACPNYPTQNVCSAFLVDTSVFDADAPFGGGNIFNVCYQYPGSSGSTTADWAKRGPDMGHAVDHAPF